MTTANRRATPGTLTIYYNLLLYVYIMYFTIDRI